MKILKFYTKECSQCRAQSRILDQLEGVEIIPVDCNEQEDLVDKYEIKGLPTLVFIEDDGEVITEYRGVATLPVLKDIIKTITND